METINLLFSINNGYVEQMKVTLYSIVSNTPEKDIAVYVLQKPRLKKETELIQFCERMGVMYHPIIIAEDAFANAPTTSRYPETIYYRLLAYDYLPAHLERILYLDADILCVNDISPLYHMSLGDKLYAACSHTRDSDVSDAVNKMRLGNYESENYYNSGVLLMALDRIREVVKREEMMAYIKEKGSRLFLPDQDVLTALYGHHIQLVPDEIYNYDTRYYVLYLARSKKLWDLDWMIENTVFLHFCGREKPWQGKYRGMFAALYKHYAHKALNL